MSQRTKTIIISIVVCVVLAGVGVGLYCAWPAIVGTITGNAYYTYEDVQNAYNDGYTDGIRNEEELTAQIDYYKGEVDKYVISLGEAQSKVDELQKNLQDAINSGNADKETIAGLQEDLAEAQADITAKQEQIEELQDDIKYYEELLEAYEDSDKLRVTFTMVDNGKERNYDVQVVEPNGYLSDVVTPDRADFEGWSLTKGGELIDDLTTIQVTENMTIYGMCTNTVTFMVNGEEYATQEVSYNKYATDVEVILAGYNLDGWSLTENGETVIVSTTPITKDTTFYALLEKVDFSPMVWNGLTDFDGNSVWTDGQDYYYSWGANQYILNKQTKEWEECEWNIQVLYGDSVWQFKGNVYYSRFDEQYKLNRQTKEWEEVKWNSSIDTDHFTADYIWTDGTDLFFSCNTEQYVLNIETYTWEEIEWNIPDNAYFQGDRVWTDGVNIYFSNGTSQYQLNKETHTWSEKSFIGLGNFHGYNVWTDGENIYYSNGSYQYQLDKATSTWTEKIWTGLTSFSGNNIWTDGVNTYYSNDLEQFILA